MLGIRASPSGTHLLLLLRGKPAEIWLVRAPWPCARVHFERCTRCRVLFATKL